MLVKCLYCDVETEGLSTGGFCENCGKKLPSSALTKTRRSITGDGPEMPGETAAVLRKSRVVSEALFAAAVVYLVAGGLFLIVGPMMYNPVPEHFAPYVLSWTVLPTLLVGVLGVLARMVPMPALWLAVLVCLVWVPVTFLTYPQLATGWVLVDMALFAMLLRAVWLGLAPENRASGG